MRSPIHVLLIPFLLSTLACPRALAVLASPTTIPSIYPGEFSSASPMPIPSGQSAQNAYCSSFCPQLVNNSGQVLGLNGTTGWTLADDQWCVDHGSPTNPAVAPDPTPTSSTPPPNTPCQVPMINGDMSCAQTTAWYNHCGWHNGQVEQQCEAYESAGQGRGGEKTVLFLDIAAAGTCAIACYTSHGGNDSPMLPACRVAGLAASTTELLETLLQKGSATSKILSSAMGGMGIYMEAKAAQSAGGLFTTNNPGKGRVMNACISALMFGVMAGVREGMIKSQEGTQNSACQQVLSLLSTSSANGAGITALPTSNGSAASGGSGGSTGSSGGGDPGLSCMGSGGTVTSCSGGSTAADTGALQNSGLGSALLPQAQQLAASPLGQQLASGNGDAGSAIGAMGGGSAGDAGGAVATVASAAQAHAQELSEGVSGTTPGGGGGGGGGGDAEQPNPMAGLAALLNPQGKDQAPAGGTLRFNGQAESTDIWHTNSEQNIFQIISTRIGKASKSLQP